MENILIAGDSWGIGVFTGQGSNYGPTGQGIQSILESQGYKITNISKGGVANYLMIDRLNGQWGNTEHCLFGYDNTVGMNIDFNTIDHIVFLQTDIFRERHYYGKQNPTDTDTRWKILEQAFVNSLLDYASIDDFINNYFKKFYTDLNTIGTKHNKKILMIGGWSQLHPSVDNYSNLVSIIPSATKLLIPELEEDCFISDPEWYTQLDRDHNFMSKFNLEFKKMALINACKLDLIYKNWHEVHPDIHGYQKIVDILRPFLAKKY
jgi:hypothetical protein